MIIKSSKNGVELELSEPKDYSYCVALRGPNMWCRTSVYTLERRGDGLPEFFKELAANWKGFNGEKSWSSLETDFVIDCQADSLGHFALEISIADNREMRCENTIQLESGQLAKIAKKLDDFFRNNS